MTVPYLFERAHQLAALALEQRRAPDLDDARTILHDAIRPLAIFLHGMTDEDGGPRRFPTHVTETRREDDSGSVAPELYIGAATAAELASHGARTVDLLFEGHGVSGVDPRPVFDVLTAASSALSSIPEREEGTFPGAWYVISSVHNLVWAAYTQAIEESAEDDGEAAEECEEALHV